MKSCSRKKICRFTTGMYFKTSNIIPKYIITLIFLKIIIPHADGNNRYWFFFGRFILWRYILLQDGFNWLVHRLFSWVYYHLNFGFLIPRISSEHLCSVTTKDTGIKSIITNLVLKSPNCQTVFRNIFSDYVLPFLGMTFLAHRNSRLNLKIEHHFHLLICFRNFILEKNITDKNDKINKTEGISNSGIDLSGEYISPHSLGFETKFSGFKFCG